MRLSEVLSTLPSKKYQTVENFIGKSNLSTGTTRNVEIGIIGINFFCKKCNAIRTFTSTKKIQCIGIDNNHISIDCVLKCPCCENTVAMWFLIKSEDCLNSYAPKVKILKYSSKLSDEVCYDSSLNEFSELFEKAEIAYRESLGAGSIVYLRKLYEQITSKMAKIYNVSLENENGKRKNFKDLLKEVDAQANIIPREFSQNRYTLFSELSNVIHGEYPEEQALEKYSALKRLLKGIFDNIKNNEELVTAMKTLGW